MICEIYNISALQQLSYAWICSLTTFSQHVVKRHFLTIELFYVMLGWPKNAINDENALIALTCKSPFVKYICIHTLKYIY